MQALDAMKQDICGIISTVVEGNPVITPDVDLLSQGLNSIYMVGVLVKLEEHYEIELSGQDLSPSNFETVESICQLVRTKLEAK